jgi:hypothetical protein
VHLLIDSPKEYLDLHRCLGESGHEKKTGDEVGTPKMQSGRERKIQPCPTDR